MTAATFLQRKANQRKDDHDNDAMHHAPDDSSSPHEQVEELHATLEHACSVAQEQGTGITYLRSLFTPGESRCRCLFTAHGAEAVRELNDAGELPYSRIVVAVELVGEPVCSSPAETPTTEQFVHPGDAMKERPT